MNTKNHVDDSDIRTAMWIALGTEYYISLPEFQLLVQLQDGDILTFRAQEIMHGLVAPPEDGEKVHCCISLYTNKGQLREVAKTLAVEKMPCHETEEENLENLSLYERKRRERMAMNSRVLYELEQAWDEHESARLAGGK